MLLLDMQVLAGLADDEFAALAPLTDAYAAWIDARSGRRRARSRAFQRHRAPRSLPPCAST